MSESAVDAIKRRTGLQRLVGSGLKTRLLHPHDEFWDRRLGIRTFGYKPYVGDWDAPDLRGCYIPTSYKKLFKMLRRAELSESDAFVDFGSGLGRAVFVASWLGAQRAVGVEIDDELAAAAQANLEQSRLKDRDIEFVNAPAEKYEPQGETVVYIYNSFGPGTLQTVLEALERDLAANPRRMRIIYENPAHPKIVDDMPCFRRLDEWPPQKSLGSAYAVAFWETRPA